MKKIIVFIIMIFCIFLVGCNSKQTQTTTIKTTNQIETTKQATNQITTTLNNPIIKTTATLNIKPSSGKLINYDFEMAVQTSTLIVEAKLLDSKKGSNLYALKNKYSLDYYDYVEYKFEVTKTIYSESSIKREVVYVYIPKLEDNINPYDKIVFNNNEKYLLVLWNNSNTSIYLTHECFDMPGWIYLSLDGDKTNNSIMVDNKLNTKNGMNLNEEFSLIKLERYIEQLVSNKQKDVMSYLEQDSTVIFNNSSNVYKIKVLSLVEKRINDICKCEIYKIEIKEVVKGNTPSTSKELVVEFYEGTVKEGDEIIIASNNTHISSNDDYCYVALSTRYFITQ